MDFVAISLPKVAANEINTYYGTMLKVYTNEKLQ